MLYRYPLWGIFLFNMPFSTNRYPPPERAVRYGRASGETIRFSNACSFPVVIQGSFLTCGLAQALSERTRGYTNTAAATRNCN